MADKYLVMLFSQSSNDMKKIVLTKWFLRVCLVCSCLMVGSSVYFVCDYLAMRQMKVEYLVALKEKEHLESEAKHVSNHLEMAKEKLKKLDDHMSMLQDLTTIHVSDISKKAGVGPLTEDEDMIKTQQTLGVAAGRESYDSSSALGLSYDDFVFKPLMQKIGEVEQLAGMQNRALQALLINLKQKRHLIFSIPVGKPVEGWIASAYGMRISPFTGEKGMHYGIDIAAPVGSPIYAPADGVVIFSGSKSGFGRFLMIAHDHGIVTKYGHNAELFVKTGEQVKRGDPIAAVGVTGRTTGPHLHYEIWVNGKPQNPKRFLLLTDMPWVL
ncbi:MAG: M23 family metallopeptidase [Proteobacteria bacterium]|nr:M23 family metallopeptidase [Pseudomonadota bacterium]